MARRRTGKRARGTKRGKAKLKKVRQYMKELAKKWKKLSERQKAKYEGKFSEYVKVMMEKKFKAKRK